MTISKQQVFAEEEVKAFFIAGALVFEVTRNNLRSGVQLASVTREYTIPASRESIDEALRKLGYVKVQS